MVLGLYAATAGVIAVLLIPPAQGVRRSVGLSGSQSIEDVRRNMCANPAFKLIIAAIVLCNLSFTMQTSQLKVLLLDRGVDSATGSLVVSLIRCQCHCRPIGLRHRTRSFSHICRRSDLTRASRAWSGPACLRRLRADGDCRRCAVARVFLGAEGDVLAYVVMKYFRLEIYSTVLGMVLGAYVLSVEEGLCCEPHARVD